MYYKLGQVGVINWDSFVLLQIRANIVTNWDSYYKLRENVLLLGSVLQVKVIITRWGITCACNSHSNFSS